MNHHRRFGRTGLAMPVISCGGMRYQYRWQDVHGRTRCLRTTKPIWKPAFTGRSSWALTTSKPPAATLARKCSWECVLPQLPRRQNHRSNPRSPLSRPPKHSSMLLSLVALSQGRTRGFAIAAQRSNNRELLRQSLQKTAAWRPPASSARRSRAVCRVFHSRHDRHHPGGQSMSGEF